MRACVCACVRVCVYVLCWLCNTGSFNAEVHDLLKTSSMYACSCGKLSHTCLFLQLLNGLVAMDTTVLLEVVVGVMCREERHAHEEQMQMKLVEFVRG